jgi:Endonuclease NucS
VIDGKQNQAVCVNGGDMEEIKLWKVSGTKDSLTVADLSGIAQTQTEEMLENILLKSPSLLASGLKLVGRQSETQGGPLDLLGVDEDGRLVVFELKRGTLTRDAVAQILDYASFLAALSMADLNSFICENSGKNGIEKINDFTDWYQGQFGKSLDTIGKPKMVLVGLGADDRARRMVEYLADGDIEMSLITFYGFNQGDEVFLARQIEIAQKEPSQSKASKSANLQRLLKKIKASGVESYFDEAATLIRSETGAYQWPNQTGYSYYFADTTESGTLSNRAYLSISIPDNAQGSMIFTLQERAIIAAGPEWSDIASSWGAKVVKRRGYVEVKISSGADWKQLEADVKKLCSAIVQGRKSRQEQLAKEEREVAKELSTQPT